MSSVIRSRYGIANPTLRASAHCGQPSQQHAALAQLVDNSSSSSVRFMNIHDVPVSESEPDSAHVIPPIAPFLRLPFHGEESSPRAPNRRRKPALQAKPNLHGKQSSPRTTRQAPKHPPRQKITSHGEQSSPRTNNSDTNQPARTKTNPRGEESSPRTARRAPKHPPRRKIIFHGEQSSPRTAIPDAKPPTHTKTNPSWRRILTTKSLAPAQRRPRRSPPPRHRTLELKTKSWICLRFCSMREISPRSRNFSSPSGSIFMRERIWAMRRMQSASRRLTSSCLA
ncbi:hypothetical protein PSRA_1570 [Pseudoscardovia radai]|uniref:Uncharacterized protein n=1 Tax=Pseudoscardovia radai TaxID=987066 RepID=A0A261ESF3_9BIFI|nr:hypothetical protein PSRA_1570 [Pseudoscardovia radai]